MGRVLVFIYDSFLLEILVFMEMEGSLGEGSLACLTGGSLSFQHLRAKSESSEHQV